MTKEESSRACGIIIGALNDKKALNIKVIGIDEISPLADYFVLASGANDNQLQAMVESVDEKMTRAGFNVNHVEGFRRGGWTLLDYGDVVVHIFDEDSRSFYDLERIWKDGKNIELSSFTAEEDA